MIKKSLLFFALLFAGAMIAQKQQASPYSFFGIGNNFLPKTVEENMMGAVGTAISDPLRLNFSNPAAQARLRFTSYSVAAINTLNQISDGDFSQSNSIFSLSYLGIGIPLGEKGGITSGVRARSSVGYSFYGSNENENSNYTFEGSGGTSSLFIGGGYTVFKGLSLGIEASYIFGKIDHVVTEQQANVTYDTRESSVSQLRGFETKLGFFYTTKIKKKNNFNLGLTLLNESEIKITEKSSFYNGYFSGESESIKEYTEPVETLGSAIMPLNTTVAIAYGNQTVWQTSIEYSFNKAIMFEGGTLENNTRAITYTDYARYSIGGYYIPKYNSLTSYFHRVIYRAGFKYENLGMELSGTPINEIGMSFGLGLPIGKGLSRLNLGFEYGIRGELIPETSLIEEKYFNVRMSLSLGDKWFKKRKIN